MVITTRKHDVAKEVDCSFKMEPRPYGSSKILFFTRIFGSEDSCPSHLSDVSEKILKKCEGVPLAIITTSSLLANKSQNIKEWNEVCDSIGSGLGINNNMDNMIKILSLSYYDLPCHLRTCLLYISIFPEDCEIDKERLILTWVAEDFVQHGEKSQSLFTFGENYFNELINRGLIQVARTFRDGTIRSCRVHDMVLELICSLSREENFVTTVLCDSRQRTASSGSKIRRLSLHNTTWPTMEMPKLRSLITMFTSATTNSMPSLSCCHLLRVLDHQSCNHKDHPSLRFVGNLFHLRYLSLAGTEYDGEFPVEMGKLQFLQTLDISLAQINELPSSIVGLRQLICLRVPRKTRLPNGLRCLKNIEDLERVTVDSAFMAEELGHLMQLRKLSVWLRRDKDGIWDENLCTALVSSLAKLHKIQNLQVITSHDVAADLQGSVESSLDNMRYISIKRATSLPTFICPASLPLLSSLDIHMDLVRTDDIRVLGMLQALRLLHVEVSGVQVLERFMVSPGAFPSAVTCSFSSFSIAPSAFPPGAMPNLKEFTFSIRLEDFAGGNFVGDDLALGHLPSLRHLDVSLVGEQDVSEEVVTEVEEKLRHEADVHCNHPNIIAVRK
ncbi:unnamed protein product [Urochloa humidicola]